MPSNNPNCKEDARKGGKATAQKWKQIKSRYRKNPEMCEQCKKPLPYKKRDNKFCSRSCAATYNNKQREIDEKTKAKISASVSKTLNNRCSVTYKVCIVCDNIFVASKSKSASIERKTCGKSCLSIRRSEAGKKSAQTQSEERRSKNEEYFAELCSKHFDKVLTNEAMFNGWDADVILPKHKIAILWNGKWHYKKLAEDHSVEQVQNRDRIKKEEIREKGYEPYVVKDMGKHNPDFVENEFEKLKSKLK